VSAEPLHRVADGVHRYSDSCEVYVITAEADPTRAVLVDFGGGAVLDALAGIGVTRVDAVLMTHHHRDQGHGLARAAAAGIPIHVPPAERDLFDAVDEMWQTRSPLLDYDLRRDRDSLLEPVPVAGVATLYRRAEYGGVAVRAVPTPGHTPGSVTYLLDRGGERIAFSGDLVHAPGRVWSLAATQWSYTENEGPAMTVLSCLLLADEEPTLLLPAHGAPMPDARAALELLADRMQRYVDSRRFTPWDLRGLLEQPYERITEHLLLNRASNAYSYVLLSGTGEALVIDYGYDLCTGIPPGTGRASRVPWLASLPALKREHGVRRVEVVLPTHYHDDHVAGVNLLRDVEGAEVWIPENVVGALAHPGRTDLPCQWFDPIPADRVLELGGTVEWRGHRITTHPLPGHTEFAAAFAFEVDGVRVLATGDQQTGVAGGVGTPREILNYQYRNRMRPSDYVASADLYRRIAPGLLVTGHWKEHAVDAAYLDGLAAQGAELVALHADLLPEGDARPVDDQVARIEPFHSALPSGARAVFDVLLHLPGAPGARVDVRAIVPEGWTTDGAADAVLDAGGRAVVRIGVTADGGPRRRARIAVAVEVGGRSFGQPAAATIDVVGDTATAVGEPAATA